MKLSAFSFGTVISAVTVVGIVIWQALTADGHPDPLTPGINSTSMVMNTAVLVFREGLEAILVLAALTASLVRAEGRLWKPVAIGAGFSFIASFVTWFVVVAALSNINAPALDVQAMTGLLAVVVLLVIMNWFFHQVYWAGWIGLHTKQKQKLVKGQLSKETIFRGLFLLGFTSVYREGFEIVLFLQSVRLRAGNGVVLKGAAIGLTLTLMVALLTWVAHYRLPYKRMLVLTGVMLGFVLLVMVGESVQEMQLASWVSTTKLNWEIPEWMNTWFAFYPSAESITSQFAAAFVVIGSYFFAKTTKRNSNFQRAEVLSHAS